MRKYKKVSYSKEISELKRKIKFLEDLEIIPSDISFWFEVKEVETGINLVDHINKDSNFSKFGRIQDQLEISFHLKSLNKEQNKSIWDVLKKIYLKYNKTLTTIDIFVGTNNENFENVEDETINFISVFYKRDTNKFINEERYSISNIVS